MIQVTKLGEHFIAGIKIQQEWIFSEPRQSLSATTEEAAIAALNSKLQSMVEEESRIDCNLPTDVQTDTGWCTPVSNPKKWVDTYQAVVEACTGKSLDEIGLIYKEEAQQFRLDVTTVMKRSGTVGPWENNPNGIPWIRISKEFDPTTRPVQAGEGDRRVLKDINGFKRRVSTGEVVERKGPEPTQYVVFETGQIVSLTEPVAGQEVPAFKMPRYYHGSAEQRRLAAARGQELAVKASAHKKDERTVHLWGMIGYTLGLMAQNLPPHPPFSNELKAAGVTEEWLLSKAGKL